MRALTKTLCLSLALFGIAGCGEPDEDGDGFVESVDCNDRDAAINSDAPEVCDGIDNNCDGFVDDDANVVDAPSWYLDRDVDGYGDDTVVKVTCNTPGGGWSLEGGDCDDTDPDAVPGGQEICNGKDDDCDGTEDEPEEAIGAEVWYEDRDFDTFGDPATGKLTCPQQVPRLSVQNGEDCDDTDDAQYPGAAEYCNNEDDDCDGATDELDEVLDGFDAWRDADDDGYGDPSTTTYVCSLPEGYSDVGGDCDDGDAVVALGCGCTTSEEGDLIVTGSRTLPGGRHDYANVVIEAGATLTFTGTEPVYLFAETVTIAGTLDIAAKGTTAGPGGGAGGSSRSCSAVGGKGGNGFLTGGGAGGGAYPYTTGGGGGGHADDGSPGANGTIGTGGSAGARFGDPTLAEDFSGGGGGGGGGADGGRGGGGGGALKIVAGEIIVTGTIDARGANGENRGYTSCYYGGGGGGGGAGGAAVGVRRAAARGAAARGWR